LNTSDASDALAAVGWTDDVARRWAAADAEGLTPARVARTDRGVVTLWPEPGRKVRATTTTAAKDLVAGDWVGYDPATRRVDRVVERATSFDRQGARGSRRSQTLAANMDVILLLEAAHPKVNERRLERALVLAHQSGATPIVVVTKVDLVRDAAAQLDAARSVSAGVMVLGVSNHTRTGLGRLRSALHDGSTVAALGASGVGKSSLVNALAGRDVQLTGGVRRGDSKGKHTTTAAQMIDLGGLLYIDTPGVRALALCGDGTGLDETFTEIAAAAEHCRFDDCHHVNEPGCAVREAVAAGTIRPERLDHYLVLLDELLATDDIPYE
jgi:ribosome biogenesis GTPase